TVVDRAGFRGLLDGAQSIADVAEFPEEGRFFLESFPFLAIANGDKLGTFGASSSVVYLCHELCGASCVISPSFQDFLTQWEQLYYVGPELWLLEVFRDPATGFINGQCEKAIELRTIIDGLLA